MVTRVHIAQPGSIYCGVHKKCKRPQSLLRLPSPPKSPAALRLPSLPKNIVPSPYPSPPKSPGARTRHPSIHAETAMMYAPY